MNYFVFLKEQQERKKLKKQAQVQENTEITFMSAWFVIGVFLVSLIIYLFRLFSTKLSTTVGSARVVVSPN